MVYELLTDEDKKMINLMRQEYSENSLKSMCDIEYFLRIWNEEKSKYLENIFKDKLILKFPIEYEETEGILYNKMQDDVLSDDRICKFRINLQNTFEDNISKVTRSKKETFGVYAPYLFSVGNLVTNKFQHQSSYYITFKDGSTLAIGKDDKSIKIITKLAKKFNIGLDDIDENGVNDLEYFRRKHSMALNQKKIKGELCLSIHPLDYITMSDNEENWSSCMSWRKNGEYRQGTVEMMNSPCVVVGYIASERNSMYETGWNSKKWRCLFVVDEDFIVSVKDYPYENTEVKKLCIQYLAEACGWGKVKTWEFKNHRVAEYGKRLIDIRFYSDGCMFCDFGRFDHHIALNPYKDTDINKLDYCYNGISECICCGEIGSSGSIGTDIGTGQLLCEDCEPSKYCQCCGNRIEHCGEYVTEDGYMVCEYCFDYECVADDHTGDVYYNDYIRVITGDVTIHLSFDTINYDGSFMHSIFKEDANIFTTSFHAGDCVVVPREQYTTQGLKFIEQF